MLLSGADESGNGGRRQLKGQLTPNTNTRGVHLVPKRLRKRCESALLDAHMVDKT